MADRRKMTLQALREQARKILGSGYSKLAKDKLIEAIEAVTKLGGVGAGSGGTATRTGADKTRSKGAAKAKPAAEAKKGLVKAVGGKAKAAAGGKTKAAAGAGGAKARKGGAATRGARAKPAAARRTALPAEAEPARAPDQLDPESYFVARVRGEDAVRDAPHPMTEAALDPSRGSRLEPVEPPGMWNEDLGDLPWSYGDDTLIALPRDPRTLFLCWDHSADTQRRAWEGIEHGRSELWIFQLLPGGGWERVRTIEFALESRSFYVHDLEPGRIYRAEIHVVDRRQDKLLPRPSNAVQLPPSGPSALVDDRFGHIAWGERLARWLGEARPGGPFAEALRAHMALLSGWREGGAERPGAGAAGAEGRPSSPRGQPGSPSSPWGGGR